MSKLVIAMIVMSLSAFAGNQQHGDNQQHYGDNQQHHGSDSSLEDLINMCERLERNPQIKQFGAEITCRGHQTSWEEADRRTIDLRTEKVIKAELSMKGDRFRVNGYSRRLRGTPGSGECNIYREIRHDYAPVTVKLNSCAELRELQREGRATFCARHLADAPMEKEEGTATGRTRNLCR